MVKKQRITNNVLVSLFLLVFLIVSGCGESQKTLPPDNVLIVLNNVKVGYNKEEIDIFCNDFSDIMFTKGFTKRAYLDVIQSLKNKLGEWESEKYLGVNNKDTYTWRVKFKNGKTKLVLVLNDNRKVIGLWFR